MEPVTEAKLRSFLQRLGERYGGPGTFYLLGGCALCLLGNPRTTVDVDYTHDVESGSIDQFQKVLDDLGAEMRLYVDEVPLAEFIPLPPQARERHRLVGRYGQLDVYIFDLYSIALSKIARGFEADLEDVLFLLNGGFIQFEELQHHFEVILPDAAKADIIPSEFRDYFEQVRHKYEPDG